MLSVGLVEGVFHDKKGEDLLAIFQKNHLKASSQITILEKASLQIEGIFRELAPNMDLMTLAKDYFLENMGPDMLKQALNKESILIELFYLIRNGKNIPRRLQKQFGLCLTSDFQSQIWLNALLDRPQARA